MNCSRTILLAASALLLVQAIECLAAEPNAAEPTPVEHVKKRARRSGSGLGTVQYSPSEREKPFFDKLDEKEKSTGGLAGDYDIAAKDGKYVGWFGIVREISQDEKAKRTTLTIEHKYFDGLTDSHILALSFNGSGDFRAVLQGIGHDIQPLSLVKAYGKATAGKGDAPPTIDAVFVRDWHWSTFTFLDASGTQRGSEKWRKLNQVDLDDIYDPEPDSNYYRKRLGSRPDEEATGDAFRRRALEAGLAVHAGSEKIIAELSDAVLRDDNSALENAIVAACKLHAEDVMVAVLIEGLNHDDENVRNFVAEGLGTLDYAAAPAVPALTKALDDPDNYVRYRAADSLGNIGPAASPAVPALVATLKDDDSYVRASACGALGKMAALAKEAVPALIMATKDEDHFVRWKAVSALGSLGPAAASAIEPLIQVLEHDDDESVRWNAADELAHVDSQGQLAVPALIRAMVDKSESVRRFAAMGLGKIGPNARPATPTLLKLLNDGDAGVRVAAAEALWKIDRNANESVATLAKIVREGDGMERYWAANAISHIGPEAKAAVPALQQTLTFNHRFARFAAAQALGSIGNAAADAVPALVERLQDADGDVRAYAAEALWKINRHPLAIQKLVKELEPNVGNDQDDAATALGEIGPPAKEAADALRNLLTDRNFGLRKVAAQALQKIEPQAASKPGQE